MTGNNGIVLQERDRHLLRELSVLRVADREQVKVVSGFGSTTRVNARLLTLTRAGLLRRFFLGTSAGGKKSLYALSAKGAAEVGVPNRGPRRRADEMLVIDSFVQHQLAVNSLYCQLKYRPILIPGAKFGRWLSFYEPLKTGSALIPDGYFEAGPSENTLAAFLEVDLGHEGMKVWRAKTEAYLHYAVSGDFAQRFRQPKFRVLVIANSARRLTSIRSLVSSLTDKIFWFADFESINSKSFWSEIWLRPRGNEPRSLFEGRP